MMNKDQSHKESSKRQERDIDLLPEGNRKEEGNSEDSSDEDFIDLNDLNSYSFVKISECEESVLAQLNTDRLISFFSSTILIDKLFIKKNEIVMKVKKDELRNLSDSFPREKLDILGSKTLIEEMKNYNAFNRQFQKFQKQQDAKKKKQEQINVLHENILPKLNKITSMEANFASSAYQKEEEKKQKKSDGIIHEVHEEHYEDLTHKREQQSMQEQKIKELTEQDEFVAQNGILDEEQRVMSEKFENQTKKLGKLMILIALVPCFVSFFLIFRH